MADKIKIAKAVAELVVGTSVSRTVIVATKSLVPAVTKIERIQLAIGAYALGAMAASKATDWSDAKVDEVHQAATALKSAFKKTETAE